MAVPVQTPYQEYTANGVATSFALGFTCDLKQELKVFINDIESELSTWSLTGGSVSFTTAPSSGSKIVLKRATKLERTTNYSSVNNSFRPEVINKDLDRIWYAIQDQNYKVGQYDFDYNFVLTQVRPIATGGTGANNPNDARNNLNTYSKEEVNALIATGGEGNVVGVAGGGTGATTVAEARTNLGVLSASEVAAAISNATPTIPNATETVAGKAKIATTEIAKAGVNDTDFITAKKLANTRKSVWSNKTGMLFGTTYVNSSLFDRDLSVIALEVAQSYVTIRCIFIDLITLVETTVFFGAHTNYNVAFAVFTIPAQTSYKISVFDTINNVTQTATVFRWAERDYA